MITDTEIARKTDAGFTGMSMNVTHRIGFDRVVIAMALLSHYFPGISFEGA